MHDEQDDEQQRSRFQWRWVVITMVLYALFYLLPILLFGGNGAGGSDGGVLSLGGQWIFGGLLLVASVAGFLSRDITIWEPVVASVGLLLLLAVVYEIGVSTGRVAEHLPLAAVIIGCGAVFFISLFGAMAGEVLQKLLQRRREDRSEE